MVAFLFHHSYILAVAPAFPLKDVDWCGCILTSWKGFKWDVFKMDRREFRLEILAAKLLAKISYKNGINNEYT